jgi:asparagine synthase (glutamine-hydrolysing)
MSGALAHRGPDGDGHAAIATDGVYGRLGHRRLRILDLTDAAHQPMVSPDGTVLLVFNGEAYNFRELRAQLKDRGHVFHSTGDTEVALRAYEEWGEGLVDRMEGMFALALWDARRRCLLLARDRVGKKPLYYVHERGRLTFASEVKALARAPWIEVTPRLDRLPQLLTFGYVPAPDTLYAGVFQVPPATVARFDVAENRLVKNRYWNPLRSGLLQADPSAIRTALDDATRRRMVADVPVGSLLSGGIDSSVVTALMSRHTSEPVRTFSIGFADAPSFDERNWARLVADRLGTQHTEFLVRPDAIALLDRLVWLHDGPFADSSAIPTHLVCGLAAEHVTVALTGDGGDEVFGGYERFTAARLAERMPPVGSRVLRAALDFLPRDDIAYNTVQRRVSRFVEHVGIPLLDRYVGWMSVAEPALLRALVAPIAPPGDLLNSLQEAYGEPVGRSALDRILHVNLMTYLPDDLAVKMDRCSMAHGLELRSPFLDGRLIELLANVPAHDKVGLVRVKPLLHRACADLIPRSVWRRRKHGFGVPLDSWFRGPLREISEDELVTPAARIRSVLDGGAIDKIWSEHLKGEARRGALLWTLLTLERWLGAVECGRLLEPTRPPIETADVAG